MQIVYLQTKKYFLYIYTNNVIVFVTLNVKKKYHVLFTMKELNKFL